MKNIIVLILILTTNFLIAQDGYWEITSYMEHPIAGGSAVIRDGKIYISGGYSKEAQDKVNWIQAYDPYQNSNEIVTDMQSPRYGHVSAIINEKLYFVGGIHDSTETNLGLEEWDFVSIDTTQLVAADSNFNRIFATGVSYDSLFYLIGGNSYSKKDGNDLSYIVEYDLTNDSIQYKFSNDGYANEFPEQQMSVIYGDDIFIFGGVLNGVLQSIQKFNISTHTLDTLDIKLLEPRAGGIAVQHGQRNEIYIIGGFNEGNSALRTVEIFIISGDDYYINSGPELNEARTNLMVVSPGEDKMIVLGGYNENGEVLSSIEQFGVSTTSEESKETAQMSFRLEQNFPNPFNPSTTIKYGIPLDLRYKTQDVRLNVYNVLGSEIATLVNKAQEPGNYEIKFDASDLPSGIYFYRLQFGNNTITKKMTVLK
ncbi:MAG: T9SS type A sorting domain-containing protein [Bacteroidota bacterium]